MRRKCFGQFAEGIEIVENQVVKVVQNWFLRKLSLYMRVLWKSYTQKPKNHYFNYFPRIIFETREGRRFNLPPLYLQQTRNSVLQKTKCSDLHLLVEAGRIELPSEKQFLPLSPGAARP